MPATFKYFTYKDRLDTNGEAAIYLRITYNRKKKYYNTGERIQPSYLRDKPKIGYWVKKSHPTYKKINRNLEIIFNEAKDAARTLERAGTISAEAIKARIIGASQNNFFKFAEQHKKELATRDQFYLRKQTVATLNKLEEYLGGRTLLFSDINSNMLQGFQDWLANEKGNKGSTIRKNMGDLRRIIDQAKRNEHIFGDPFKDVKPVKMNKPTYKVKLSYDKIQAIEALDLPEGSNLWHSRNAFILSFYFCGMRFGDLAMLRWENVEHGELNYVMGKTVNEVKVNIRDKAQRFLEMYRTGDDSPESFIFPFLEGLSEKARHSPSKMRRKASSWNAVVNQELKTIQDMIGMDDTLSMHVARHSFAQYGVNKGLSKYKMQMLLGHSSVRTTENYLKKIDVSIVNDAMDMIFE